MARIRTRKNGRKYPIRKRKSYGFLDVAPDKGIEHRHSVSHHLGRKRIEADPSSFAYRLVSKKRKALGRKLRAEIRESERKQREFNKKYPYNFDFLGEEDQIGQFF